MKSNHDSSEGWDLGNGMSLNYIDQTQFLQHARYKIDGLIQKKHNSIANALELRPLK